MSFKQCTQTIYNSYTLISSSIEPSVYSLNNFLSASTSYFLALAAVSLLLLSQLFIWPFTLLIFLPALLIFFSLRCATFPSLTSLLHWIFQFLKQLRLEMILYILLNSMTLGLWHTNRISATQMGIFLRFLRALIQLFWFSQSSLELLLRIHHLSFISILI